MRYDLIVLAEFISTLLFSLPRFRAFNALKSFYLRAVWGAKIGKRAIYYPGVWIFSGRQLQVGDDVDFAQGVLITTDGGLSIGDRTLIGYGTHILTRNHKIPPLPGRIFSSGHEARPVSIGEDVWIGAACTILPGAIIGDNSVIAAGSVVRGVIPPGSIAAGVPARVVRIRT